jgi:hypothetical protein
MSIPFALYNDQSYVQYLERNWHSNLIMKFFITYAIEYGVVNQYRGS